jgi:group I intron endonuclease
MNNKIYIGSSKDIKRRLRIHKWMLLKNEHYNNYIQSSWNKYGCDSFSFEVLEETSSSKDILLSREKFFIDAYNSANPEFGFNQKANPVHPQSFGSKNGMFGKTHSLEVRKKLSELATKRVGELNPNYGNGKAILGKNNPFYGRRHSDETKKKISEAKRGAKHKN